MQVFLSHATEDARIAGALKLLIERCSFQKASVWFSSDTSATGGVTPGGPWFDQLVARISDSAVFLALITPTSADNLWLHYEAGCAATKGVPIIPVAAGVSVNDVRLPLSLYNAYNVSQPDGLKTLLMKMYQAHGIQHDEAMLETPIQHTVREITAALDAAPRSVSEGASDGDRILRLVDKRFMDLIEAVSANSAGPAPTYSVSAVVKKGGKTLQRVALDISDSDSIQDVANALYFKIEKYVQPFKYLEQWVVRDVTLGVNLIMRDFLGHVKASAVLRPGHQYEIILLSRPYDPSKGDFQSLS